MNKRKIINDPVYGFLTIDDDILYDVVEHHYFQRLRNIKQLGFTYYVYPGATHNRFGHALGTLNLMGRALDVLKVKEVDITQEEALGAKLAILLHDIGHGPFSHALEQVLVDKKHEEITHLFMERMNEEFGGRLSLAISIFDDTYPKHFLHQLVSSQLDMDRLDYLSRDSFFSGVSEGVVGTERIINMLNVHDDELVVDVKGVYSVEKFILSRRLMYWQVYLHKTVVATDMLLINIMKRAKELIGEGRAPKGPEMLMYFLQNGKMDIDKFALLDDNDVMVAIKGWMNTSEDKVLRCLSEKLINRRLPAVDISDRPIEETYLDTLRMRAQRLYGISAKESRYFVGTGVHENHAYDFQDQEVRVLFKNGACKDISEASDQLDRRFLEKTVKKYYVFFPKELAPTR
ncbi:MAG: HD domain-containing protein [Bacteroidales bacterium]|nr:HD domain-containing protein [Bacteroidales bacterium]